MGYLEDLYNGIKNLYKEEEVNWLRNIETGEPPLNLEIWAAEQNTENITEFINKHQDLVLKLQNPKEHNRGSE